MAVTWKIAQYHKPMRPHVSSKSEGNNQYNNWASLFYNYGVKLVVECDAHTVKSTWPVRPSTSGGSDEGFVRDDTYGTVYVGEGCWGAPLRSNNDNKNWTRNSGAFNQIKWIFVDQSKIETRTLRTDNAANVGSVSDSDIFRAPSNLDIWNPSNGSVITILNNNVTPPTAQVTSPADGTNYSSPQTITITASAADADGSVSSVRFFVNGSFIGTDNSAPYSRNFSIPADGLYDLIVRATDNEGNTTDSDVVTISAGVVSTSTSSRISDGADDVEERSDGSMYNNSSDLELVYDGGNQVVGLYFRNLNLPQGATINSANLQFTTDETNSGTTNLTIRAHDTNAPSAFSSSTNNLSNRALTSASVNWSPGSWSSVGQKHTTPNLASVIQELVDRSGWTSSSNVALIISGTGERTAEAYEGSSGNAALLTVNYTVGGGGGTPPCLGAGSTVSNFPYAESFESGLGAWQQAANGTCDDINWTRDASGTPSSSTGPSSGSAGSYYLYTEASSPNYPSKDAVLYARFNLASLSSPEMTFDWHMYGSDMGTVWLQASTNSGSSWTTLWAKTGNQGTSWQSATVDLSSYSGPVLLRFYGRTGSSYRSDLALDNLRIENAGSGGGGSSDPVTTSARVSASTDDAEEGTNGTIYTNSSDLELVYDSYNSQGNQQVGMIFRGHGIPSNATITNAYVQFTADETTNDAGTKYIYGHDTDDSYGFSSTSSDISGRAKTSAAVSWNPGTWSTVGGRHNTPNLAAVIQEIVDRSGYTTGNDIGIIITGSGRRTAESFDGSAGSAPLLVVTYTTPAARGGVENTAYDTQANESTATALKQATINGLILAVYPNPVQNELTLEIETGGMEGPATLKVADLNGRELLTKAIQLRGAIMREHITTAQWAEGLYLVELLTDSEKVTVQVIK
ncbi:MAG: Ig-like domain-containing protein [Bacteroidota bacterium]